MLSPIHKSWKNVLQTDFDQQYFQDILEYIESETIKGKTIYPPEEEIFAAFTLTSFSDVRVVILGQDPYHGAGQAHGLSFSVPEGIRIPPSLKNIYKELLADIGGKMPVHGNLEHWSRQGVLLLNAILTVEAGQPASHRNIGRELFTDNVIRTISRDRSGVVFLLWGNFAKKKKELIDTEKHIILEAPHPSPFSAYTGFFGCKHFSQTNDILQSQGGESIDWLQT